MKGNKAMKKSVSLVLVLVLLCSALLGVSSFAADESTPSTLEVASANLQFAETIYLLIAVDYTGVYESLEEAQTKVTLKVTNTAREDEVYTLTPDASITKAGCVCFTLTELGAKNMGDQLTLQALNNGKASGDAKTYSILEYALKAKGASATLDAVCDAMIAYGDAAQTAYGTKSTATYDLSKDYGIVVVKGSVEGKKLAEVGSTASFTANTAKTGANAALYDYSFAKVTDNGTFTVTSGSQKYMFLGDAHRTAYNLDFTIGNIAAGTVIMDGAKASSSRADSKVVYSTIAGGASLTSSTDSKGWTVTSSAKEVANDYASIVEVDGEKCLQWMIDDNASGSGQINGTNGLPTGGNTVFTMSFTIGKVAGKKLIGGPRFRGTVNGANMNGSVYSWAQAGNNGIKLWNKDSLAVTFQDGEFKTIHMVVDPANNMVSCYVDSAYLGAYTFTGNDKTILATSTSYRLDWTSFAKGAQMNIKRVVITMGDIFE